MTPFNTPYTPFSLGKFMTLKKDRRVEVDHVIELDGPVEQLLVLLSKCLIPMIWFGNQLDQIVMTVVPSDLCESPMFIQIKNIVISCCTVAVASCISIVAFPLVIVILFFTFPLWMTILCICFIRFFLAKRSTAASPKENKRVGGATSARFAKRGSSSSNRTRYRRP